jgi:hypothetical protein
VQRGAVCARAPPSSRARPRNHWPWPTPELRCEQDRSSPPWVRPLSCLMRKGGDDGVRADPVSRPNVWEDQLRGSSVSARLRLQGPRLVYCLRRRPLARTVARRLLTNDASAKSQVQTTGILRWRTTPLAWNDRSKSAIPAPGTVKASFYTGLYWHQARVPSLILQTFGPSPRPSEGAKWGSTCLP